MAFTLSVIKNSTSAYNIVVPGGFEPPQTEPKSVVLPLHHRTIYLAVYIGLEPTTSTVTK